MSLTNPRRDLPLAPTPHGTPALKILVVHPGASMSTADVYHGLFAGLKARGHKLAEFALDARIERSGAWLDYTWKRGGKVLDRPTVSDILYHAGQELHSRAVRVLPDVVLVVSAMYLHPDVLVLLRRSGIRTAVLFTESPYDDEKQEKLLPWVDVAWTNERLSARTLSAESARLRAVPDMRTYGRDIAPVPDVRYVPHAWHPDKNGVHGPADASVPAHDVVFVGTGFEERIETLEAIDFDGLDFALYGSWDLLGSRNKLRRHIRGGYVDNEYATMLYRRAKVGLNLYRTSKGFGKGAPRVDRAESLNPRAYELAAAGCLTVSDYRDEVGEVFGDLVPTFSRPEDARGVIDALLADPERCARIRAALPGRVQAHTWHDRAAMIERDLYGAGIGAGHTQNAGATDGAMTPLAAAAGG